MRMSGRMSTYIVYRKVRRVKARYHGQKPTPIMVDIGKVDKIFKQGYKDFEKLIAASIADDVFKELEKVYKEEPVYIPPDLWAKIVYIMASAYKKNSEKKVQLLAVLRILWLGRFASYVNHTKDMGTKEAEKEIEVQAEIFEQERDYLISIY